MKIHWATVIVATVALLVLGALAVWGRALGLPEDAHAEVLTFLGAIGMIVLAYMRSALTEVDPLKLRKGDSDDEEA